MTSVHSLGMKLQSVCLRINYSFYSSYNAFQETTRICREYNTFQIAFKSTFRRNRFHGLTSCARRVKSALICLSLHWARFSWIACMPEGHSSLLKVEFVHCQAEKFRSKQISSIGWHHALEGWKVFYCGSLRIWSGFSNKSRCIPERHFLSGL